MIDPMLKAMFDATVLPAMKMMPTDQLAEIQTYLDEQISAELTRRERNAAIDAADADD